MQWSKLKARLDSTRARALIGRLELRVTRYRHAHDQLGRAWVTFDGREVFDLCDHRFWMESDSISSDLQAINRTPSHLAQRQAISITTQKGNLARWDFIAAGEAFLGLSIHRALASENPLMRGLAVIDRRVGHRCLKEMLASVSLENPLVRALLEVRCAAEGIRVRQGGDHVPHIWPAPGSDVEKPRYACQIGDV
jgi:hypothetical protein